MENTELSELQRRLHDAHSSADGLRNRIDELERENAKLRKSAQAVIDRWETPLWKEAEPTAAVIYRLRDLITTNHKERVARGIRDMEQTKRKII